MTDTDPGKDLSIIPGLSIPRSELDTRAISGGGPGGQHVNKSATRITLRWNVRLSSAVNEVQRERILERLASRLDSEGSLRIVAGEYRSQAQNRRAALERLQALLRRALMVRPVRKATRVPRRAVERRLEDKRRRGALKAQRRSDSTD